MFRFPDDLAGAPLLLPGPQSHIRAQFGALATQLGMALVVAAEVDDMAMMRLFARDSNTVALLPSIVVRDELKAGLLEEYCVVPGVVESFFAVTEARKFPHPLLAALLDRQMGALL